MSTDGTGWTGAVGPYSEPGTLTVRVRATDEQGRTATSEPFSVARPALRRLTPSRPVLTRHRCTHAPPARQEQTSQEGERIAPRTCVGGDAEERARRGRQHAEAQLGGDAGPGTRPIR